MKTIKAALWLFVLALGLGLAVISLPQAAAAQNNKCQEEAEDDDGDDQDPDEELSADERKKVKITMEQAKGIALKRVAGTILDAELEKERGRIHYAIDICDGNGKIWEVEIDATTGDVLQAEQDDDGDDTTALPPSRRRQTWLTTR